MSENNSDYMLRKYLIFKNQLVYDRKLDIHKDMTINIILVRH